MTDKQGWQPIETAPQDQMVIVYAPWIRRVVPAKFYSGSGPGRSHRPGWHLVYSPAEGEIPVYGEPSHWMPLPEPPA